MRIAIPVWNNRVSPVFDVSTSIRIADISAGTITHEESFVLENDWRPSKLAKLGIDLLICAAISGPLEKSLRASGIEVVADTCGTFREIVRAIASGDTVLNDFRSPGFSRTNRTPKRKSTPLRLNARGSK
jgi:predicted Fe-Mo cluster-binding NifX family protein